ncbi:TetR/AcrR family transcriptional regulator C-terminal domain-containing protein [Tsukamurella paurometabola]|uniref:Transcriptional regulator, TetR family n=1 Tax=Tsukamurella paurometabola (strain ATCC 8368 / DSM 20162 / CCUG 35730 / CIP 100753 / JCM 10117 / KCTC 9821 / NBRC 16120 / NCIMB 702349 / NCTC 13040) TaxID=521096 RepID=D5UQX4_TSUPD|nr:TetR/AcrR family transcriptional regulator C-terminal domain-containing protein [Tsukamurella paurometabola]ADG78963.1 transcriptional regulator, TetR family [Tsukamurella paurometabola DSM 20162]SUP33632.1 Tetracycline repressor protein class B from transposon Tn10 [Tsukamurella paurometabola]
MTERQRVPLTRDRVVAAGVALADASGLAAVTMRAVAGSLGVEAMSLYNHVANRADLLDGMIDAVFGEIGLPVEGDQWRSGLRALAGSTRDALRRHPWAIGLMDSRQNPGPATLRHHDTALGLLRRAGFGVREAVRAVAVLDGYVYGSVLTERSLPVGDDRSLRDAAEEAVSAISAADYPYLVEVASDHARTGFDDPGFDAEFTFGLDLIVAGLEPGAG